MAFVNELEKQIAAKIVYFGPELSGKRSNLRFLYENFPEERGKALRLDRKGETAVFMEMSSADLGKIGPYGFRAHLYAPAAELADKATLQALFRGVDGIVFVADAHEERLDENRRVMDVMRKVLENLKLDAMELPVVLQFSKAELPGALAEEDLDEELNAFNAPFYSANPVTGVRVEETFAAVARLAYRKIKDELKGKKFGGWYKYTSLEALLKKNFDDISDYSKEMAAPAFESDEFSQATNLQGAPNFEGIEQSGELDELDALLEETAPAEEAGDDGGEDSLEELFGEGEAEAKEDPLARTILAGQGAAIRDLVEDLSPAGETEPPAEGVKTVVSRAKAERPMPSPAAPPPGDDAMGRTMRVDRNALSLDTTGETGGETSPGRVIEAEIRPDGAGGSLLSIPLDIPKAAAGRELRLTLELRIRLR